MTDDGVLWHHSWVTMPTEGSTVSAIEQPPPLTVAEVIEALQKRPMTDIVVMYTEYGVCGVDIEADYTDGRTLIGSGSYLDGE